jgi:hypothetical protein
MGIPPLYFLDEMSADEVIAIYKAKDVKDRMVWEQHRQLCFYTVIAMNGTKDYKNPQDLFPLPWDDDYEERMAEKPKGEDLTRDEFLDVANKIIGNG